VKYVINSANSFVIHIIRGVISSPNIKLSGGHDTGAVLNYQKEHEERELKNNAVIGAKVAPRIELRSPGSKPGVLTIVRCDYCVAPLPSTFDCSILMFKI
jgi:hypothetical protein